MRYVLAIAALVLSGVMLILGIGQRTFLAGPSEISFPVDTKSEAGYAMVDGSQFGKVTGQANVVVKGSQAFVATGATRDVEAWLEPFLHAELSVDTKQKRLLSGLVAAAVVATPAPSTDATTDATTTDPTVAADGSVQPLDPRGSDLWLEERAIDEAGSGTETETLRVPVSVTDGQSVIIASNGENPVPSDVSLVWVQDRATPWAGPLLVGGGILALVGGVLYLLAVDHDRRGLGPRRGRRGPLQGIRNMFGGRKGRSGTNGGSAVQRESVSPKRRSRATRRLALPSLVVVAAVGLTGCSANYWPSFSPAQTEEATTNQPESNAAPVPVTDAQLDRIVERVATVAEEGDASLDAAVLESRFTGDALAQRTANYTIRAADAAYPVVPPHITSKGLDYELVQSTESWPRTLFVTVASSTEQDTTTTDEAEATTDPATEDAATEKAAADEKASPSLAMILTQQNPHDNYQVSRVIALRGGISMPQAAPADEGTALLANDLETFVMQPGEVGTAFAEVLQTGSESEAAKAFDLSTATILENYGIARTQKDQAASDDKGQTMVYSVEARQGDEKPVALSTGVGGALVSTTVIEDQIIDSNGGRFKPQASAIMTALSGLSGEQDRIVQEVAHQLLFFVPSKTEGTQIELLGVTSELVGMRN